MIGRKFKSLRPYNLNGVKSLINRDKFDLNRVKVKTKDGFILSLFNLRHKTKHSAQKDPVIFQHGIGSSGSNWLMGGSKLAPACILASRGHDVYIVNSRGTVYSLDHSDLSTNSEEFWQYSFQDMKYDILANIEHVHEATNKKKIHYIGHSQGAVSMLAALADPDREVANQISPKLHTFYCLAPVVFTKRNGMSTMKYSSKVIQPYRRLMSRFGVYGLTPAPEEISLAKKRLLDWPSNFNKKYVFKWNDSCTKYTNTDLWGVYMGFYPHGHSFHAMDHFMQIHTNGGLDYFKKYDHGEEMNLMKYGSPEPPSYDFGLVEGRVRLLYGDKDRYIGEEDMGLLGEKLAGNPEFEMRLVEGYGHISFSLGLDNFLFYSGLIKEDLV